MKRLLALALALMLTLAAVPCCADEAILQLDKKGYLPKEVYPKLYLEAREPETYGGSSTFLVVDLPKGGKVTYFNKIEADIVAGNVSLQYATTKQSAPWLDSTSSSEGFERWILDPNKHEELDTGMDNARAYLEGGRTASETSDAHVTGLLDLSAKAKTPLLLEISAYVPDVEPEAYAETVEKLETTVRTEMKRIDKRAKFQRISREKYWSRGKYTSAVLGSGDLKIKVDLPDLDGNSSPLANTPGRIFPVEYDGWWVLAAVSADMDFGNGAKGFVAYEWELIELDPEDGAELSDFLPFFPPDNYEHKGSLELNSGIQVDYWYDQLTYLGWAREIIYLFHLSDNVYLYNRVQGFATEGTIGFMPDAAIQELAEDAGFEILSLP